MDLDLICRNASLLITLIGTRRGGSTILCLARSLFRREQTLTSDFPLGLAISQLLPSLSLLRLLPLFLVFGVLMLKRQLMLRIAPGILFHCLRVARRLVLVGFSR